MTGQLAHCSVLGWPVYTARFEATRPPGADRLADSSGRAEYVARTLDWMDPRLEFTADGMTVQLSLHAPSAEAALAHVRGTLRSALHGAGIPAVSRWPLVSLSVGYAGESGVERP